MRERCGGFSGKVVGVLAAVLVLLARAPIAAAISDAERAFLSLYFTEEELQVVTATRSLQSIARIAENVTVVTAADIELMNAHTMEEVLQTVPGVVPNIAVQFVTGNAALIQGPDISDVTVLLDGVPLNNLSDVVATLGTIPVTDIEKVEVIRGPASSVWGSAMGGVVNIITKRPGRAPFRSEASLDYGSENTGDYRAAISGTIGRLGYRLSGTNLRTDGLVDGFDARAGHVGARLDYAVADRTNASFTLFYGDTDRGDGLDRQYDLAWGAGYRRLVSQLAVSAGVGPADRLDFSLWATRFDEEYTMSQLGDGTELSRYTFDEHRAGATAKCALRRDRQDVVVGADYSEGTMDASIVDGNDPEREEWAVYANDTLTFGSLNLIAGLRYDDASTAGSFWSPSLGATYLVAKDTLLRATVARGFTLPSLFSTSGNSEINRYRANPDLTVEKMWSYQAGFESGILDAVWLKVTAYRHDVEDAIQDEPIGDDWWTKVNAGNQRREGLDVEMRTKPIRGFTFAGSACFLRVEDRRTAEDVPDLPTTIYDVSLKYDDERSFRALLKGRHLQWDLPEGRQADLSGTLVDLDVAKRFVVGAGASLEAFVSIHNLLDQHQYPSATYPNPDRWVEGGLRASF